MGNESLKPINHQEAPGSIQFKHLEIQTHSGHLWDHRKHMQPYVTKTNATERSTKVTNVAIITGNLRIAYLHREKFNEQPV